MVLLMAKGQRRDIKGNGGGWEEGEGSRGRRRRRRKGMGKTGVWRDVLWRDGLIWKHGELCMLWPRVRKIWERGMLLGENWEGRLKGMGR